MNATILELAVARGVTANALKKWRKRGKVPHKYRLPLIEAAQKKGLPLASRDFDFGPPKGRAKRARVA